MKSSTAPSGGSFASSSWWISPFAMLGVPTIRTGGRSGHAQKVEQHRLGAGQGGSRLLAEPEAHPAVRLRAGDHGVLGDEHGEPAAEQVPHRLEDADVRFHAYDDGLL